MAINTDTVASIGYSRTNFQTNKTLNLFSDDDIKEELRFSIQEQNKEQDKPQEELCLSIPE